MKPLILILSILLTYSYTHAENHMTGNNLLKNCSALVQKDGDLLQAGECIGFLNGFTQGLFQAALKMALLETKPGKKFEECFKECFILPPPAMCLPKALTIRQLARVTLKYLNNHPEKLHHLAGSLVDDAFKEAFPCPK